MKPIMVTYFFSCSLKYNPTSPSNRQVIDFLHAYLPVKVKFVTMCRTAEIYFFLTGSFKL